MITMMIIYQLFVILIVMAVKADCLIVIYRTVLRLRTTAVFILSLLNAVRKILMHLLNHILLFFRLWECNC